jgi:predicted permease
LKRLMWVPLAGAAIAALGILLDDSTAGRYYRAVLIVAALITAISAYVTTTRFAAGDKLFASWLCVGIGYILSTIRYSIRLIGMLRGADLPVPRAALDGMLILQNLAIAVALLMFVLAWRSTGLGQSPGWMAAAGIVVALVVGGYPLMQGFQTRNADTVLLISTLGDVVGIALIVPLVLSALSLRGGLLMYTWLYLALCETFWLLYDVWLAVRDHLGAGARAGVAIEQMIRVAAILFAFIASVAQRRAVPRN